MLKDVMAEYYLNQNYNCAESVLRGANDYYDLGLHDRDMILVGGFGAGMQTGSTCGALLSAIAVISMKYVEKKAHESADIKPAATLLTDKFEAVFSTQICGVIKPQVFDPSVRCLKTVNAACDLIEEVLAEYEKQ